MSGIFRRELNTEIVIGADAEAVWKVLTDFDRYIEWNPFISGIEGRLASGERLTVHFARDGSKGVTFRPTVLYAEKLREVRWLGHLILPLLFDGEHRLVIDPIDEKHVRFTQREVFTGLLVPLLWRDLDTNTRQGFQRMNRALKERVEQIDG
jgi:hypothetical protein